MGRRLLTGMAGLVVAAAVVVVAPVASASLSELFVDNTNSACSNAGTGTQSQPYCTIGAAIAVVQAGQTVTVVAGTYNESVTINKSGTPGSPITLRHVGAAAIKGDRAGVTIDGQHDVSVSGFTVISTVAVSSPLIALRNSTRLAVANMGAITQATGTVGMQLTGVTDSTLTVTGSSGPFTVAGMSLDAATTGNVIQRSSVSRGSSTGLGTGIDIAGPGNSFIGGAVSLAHGAGITIEATAVNTVVASFSVVQNTGGGIHNAGARGTAITNNTVNNNCGLAGIQVDGDSSGVSVQNNLLNNNGGINQTVCAGLPADGVGIGVYGNAVNGTVVDYNALDQRVGGDHAYAWNTPLGSLAEFQQVSGQGAHDVVADSGLSVPASLVEDSANSLAPGFQSTDRTGRPREDDPSVPNTGAGPVAYADRGADEAVGPPIAALTISYNPLILTATLDASASRPGWLPIVSYTFDFGDGTKVTQSSPVGTHRYTSLGPHDVSATMASADGVSATWTQELTVYRAYCGPRRC